jgi:hypothetical protein
MVYIPDPGCLAISWGAEVVPSVIIVVKKSWLKPAEDAKLAEHFSGLVYS